MESERHASTRIASARVSDGAVVHLDRVDVAIDGTRILEDLTWRLDAGTHWGVTGGNGSGKSTFLALVAGARWPVPGTGARRYDFGRGPERDAVTARRRITLVGHELQDRYTKLDWNFTAADVVLSGIHRTDIPRREPAAADLRKAHGLTHELGLGDLAERHFLELSRGEQRRVLIARAFAFAPRVLLLDEPASGLDTAARAALDALVARVAASAQIVVAAHAAEQLPGVVTHVLELEHGRISRQGAVERRANARARTHARARRPSVEARGLDRDAALVDIRDATVWLGGRRALAGVDWQLHPDEHWLVTGANGAGKSTLLRLVHGQLRPAVGGTIRWPGLGGPRNVWRLRQRVAWVAPELQARYVYKATVAECIGSGFASSIGLVRALSAAERARVAELLRAFELEPLASRALTSLSYGQMRRVLIARALAPRPRVLLLDEPWEGLDADTTALVADRLRAARAAGTQLVTASHLGDFGLGLDHELVLEHGAVIHRAPRTATHGDAAGAPRENSTSAQRPGSGCRAR